jgi:PAB-dependent poly(A)-specific ribonuclease subunit 3
MRGNEQNCESLFIPDKLREALTKKNELTLKTMAQSNLPSSAGVYFDLVPLSMNPDRTKRSYGYHNSLYKATSNTNGRAYALRRIEDVRIEKDRSISTIHNWIKLRHSNVAQAVDAFTTIAFGDNSLLVVYDYYPDAKSLYEQHIFSNLGKPEPITMEILWTYMCQIAAGIAAVHSRKMVVRSLSLKKIIVTSKNRIRLSDCGVFDILEYSEMLDAYELIQLQEKDLIQFGETMFELAQKFVSKDKLRQYTEEDVLSHPDLDPAFQKALKYLRDTDHAQSIEELQQLICQRLFKELDRLEHSADFYENQLMRELENARIVRLMSKINFIIDRPEYEQNKHWLPTGDRHPIKLFHQHVFNQVDSNGKPVLDLAHVLINLNKLDAGIEERIMLVSPDETECLIVSYKEIKDLIEKSFRELTKDMSV